MKVSNKKLNNSLATVLVVVGAVALVPAAMGVAQYTTDPDQSKQNKSIYIAQSFFVAIATIIIVLGIVLFIVQAVQQHAAVDGFRSRTGGRMVPSVRY